MTQLTITELSDRTRLLTFDDAISVMLVLGNTMTFLCDTHLGPDSMDLVNQYLHKNQRNMPVVVFNSHSDWDHIWGNCAFPDSLIIGHTYCRRRMEERGIFDLTRMGELIRGRVTLMPPNLTFDTRICFEEEELVFFHAPGHTIDSSVCYDKKSGILFVGDLVEDPIPYLDYDRLDTYIKTLEMLLSFPAHTMISAHSGIIPRDLIRDNIQYIRSVRDGMPVLSERFGSYREVHQINLNTLLLFRYEKIARERLHERFDFTTFWSVFPDLGGIDTDTVEELAEQHLDEMTGSG